MDLFIIFGATGDLARNKLLPAILAYTRSCKGYIPLTVLGVGRRDLGDNGFRDFLTRHFRERGLLNKICRRFLQEFVYYVGLGSGGTNDYRWLSKRITEIEQGLGLSGNRVIYLALPPKTIPDVVEELVAAGVSRGSGWTRIVLEKPFGYDLSSSETLDALLHNYFKEDQIYRIDHYLGKETVQNLLFFRFSNVVFESLWNRDWIDNIQITVSEEIGVGSRAAYYDEIGALRDMVQNHLIQILTLVAMEMPTTFDAPSVRYEKVKVLRSIQPILPEDVVFGQYRGYTDEPGIPKDSKCETYSALKLEISNLRWQGVPFFLRTGKRLKRRVTRVDVVFRCTPRALFKPFDACSLRSNLLTITLQPDEGFDLFFDVKMPGQPIRLETQRLSFRYEEAFGKLPDPYGTLIGDILAGDQTLFVSSDEVRDSWRLFTPILEARPKVFPYEPGSNGPIEADELLSRFGRSWAGS